MPMACSASRRVPRLLTCQPSASAFQCSTVAKSQTLLLRTVATCVPSMAHITFGASVMIFRSWSSAGRGRARCGDRRAFSRISRSTRLRAMRSPSRTRSRAQTLRWPSPDQGERARSARIAASRAVSGTAGFGPRRPVGRAGAKPCAACRAR